jgi:molecular chaperone DnaK
VAAKDIGTGKEQTVRIEQSSGLSDDEIQRMQKDAELHAAEDKAKRELVELRNQASQMCFQIEKLIKENEDKLSDADKAPLEQAMAKTKEVAETEDVSAIKAAINELEQASHALSKTLYETAGAAAASPEAETAGATADGDSADDDAIDAEFEVKDS